MLLLSSVKLTCALMGLVLGVFPFTATFEQFIVAFATSMLIISALGLRTPSAVALVVLAQWP